MASRQIKRGSVGENIRVARLKMGMTQMELQERLGYAQNLGSVVRGWESGKRLPPLDMIRQIADVLKMPLEDLIP